MQVLLWLEIDLTNILNINYSCISAYAIIINNEIDFQL